MPMSERRRAHGESRMPDPKYAAYEAANPYFELVRGALGDLVDGEHFFDIVADDVVYEVALRRRWLAWHYPGARAI
jgi:ketosteroid isomerase-like protein